jgi:hypothetical protein
MILTSFDERPKQDCFIATIIHKAVWNGGNLNGDSVNYYHELFVIAETEEEALTELRQYEDRRGTRVKMILIRPRLPAESDKKLASSRCIKTCKLQDFMQHRGKQFKGE